jgi:phosphoribosylformylglycinamidine synthase
MYQDPDQFFKRSKREAHGSQLNKGKFKPGRNQRPETKNQKPFPNFAFMKFGIVVFPGSNCDRDMHDALKYDLQQDVQMLWHKDQDLKGFTPEDCIVLPGGFSYGDYLRTGAIARFSPIMQAVMDHARNGGKVLGVCNGFQILCEAQLLPGALLRNNNQQYICKNLFVKDAGDQVYKIPIAHGEGRYYADDATLDRLEANGQVILRYCDETGQVTPEANPNGSARNIAGISNESRNVFGMMPHPERACSPLLGNTDGRKVFNLLFSLALDAMPA